MIRLYLKLITSILFACLLLSLTARALGNTQPPNPALRGFSEGCEDKPQPCWYGIVPGVTTLEEVNGILNTAGYALIETGLVGRGDIVHSYGKRLVDCKVKIVTYPNVDKIQQVQHQCQFVTLGDLVVSINMPTSIQDRSGYAIRLLFNHNISVLESGEIGWSSLFAPIHLIDLFPTMINDNSTNFAWHGLVQLWQYCELEPEIKTCYLRNQIQ